MVLVNFVNMKKQTQNLQLFDPVFSSHLLNNTEFIHAKKIHQYYIRSLLMYQICEKSFFLSISFRFQLVQLSFLLELCFEKN